MKNNCFVIIFFEFKPKYWEARFKSELEYFKKLTPNNDRLVILDLTSFCFKKGESFYDHTDKEVDYIKINFIQELRNFFKDKKTVFVLNAVISSLNSLYIFYLLKKFKVKTILLNNRGHYANMDNKNIKLINKFKTFLQHRFSYYFARLFSIFNIIPKIDYYFETSQKRINVIENSFSNKLKNKTKNFIDISYIRKIFRINSTTYDDLLKPASNNKIEKKYIVLVDSGFDHGDRVTREIITDKSLYDANREIYYGNLFKFLKSLEQNINMQIVYCKHPKSFYPENGEFKKINDKYCNKNYEADDYLYKANIVIFTGGSSMINKAVMFKKKIMLIKSKYIGEYMNSLLLSFLNQVDLYTLDLDSFKTYPEFLEDTITKKINNYDKFIKEHLVFSENKTSYEQIKDAMYT